MKSVSCGIDLLESYLKTNGGKKRRVGVLCHPSSIDGKGRHLIEIVESQSTLVCSFGPQHGIHGETQDNMIEWQDGIDSKGRPVYSLYGQRRKPSDESLSDIDLMVIDLFDVGARLYTFIYTMSYMLEACGRLNIPVLICDRPNPLGGEFIEGNLLNTKYRSFVGLHSLPMCHGMTIGELANQFIREMQPAPQLKILRLKNWKRSMRFPETGLPWTLPSPNMPSYHTARIFPGAVFLEATSLSEGRGTTRPFELIGAPFFDWSEIKALYLKKCKELDLKPLRLHRQGFIPTFHKFSGQLCFGALQLLPSEKGFQPVRHASLLLWIFRKLYGGQWSWLQPPYEYEYEKMPIDILAGEPLLRECIDSGGSLKSLFKRWSEHEKEFRKRRKNDLIYSP